MREALHTEPLVKQQAALDGIVGMGGDASLAILVQPNDPLPSDSKPSNASLHWLDEAL